MIGIKIASDRIKRELANVAEGGQEELRKAQQLQENRRRDLQLTRAKEKAKQDKQDTRQNYDILQQFAVTPTELKKFYERFLEVDTDESGSITYEEFCLVLEEPDSDILRKLFEIFDFDDSGTVEMKELIVGLAAYCQATSKEERLKFAFMICDDDNTGYLEQDDIARILKANFLAQQCTAGDIKRRVEKIFRLANVRGERISFAAFIDVSKRVSGLVYPAYALLEETATGASNEAK